MVWVESVIAHNATVNNAVATLTAVSPTSLTTRTGHGAPLLTHFAAFTSTDDVEKVYCVPSGFADQNGIPCPYVQIYGATNSFDLWKSKLPTPVRIPENRALTIYAQSETAANTVVQAWMVLQYPNGGKCIIKPSGDGNSWISVRRAYEHGAALVSNTVANSTAITSMISGKKYWPSQVGHAGVNGATAGLVGPAYVGFSPMSEFEGAKFFVPLCNNLGYSAAGGAGIADFEELGIPMPLIDGGNTLQLEGLGFTAEQPQAELSFLVDKP